jgi:acyl-CoA thioesterase FadM
MSLFQDAGYTISTFGKLQLGPVALNEHTYYLKEVLGAQTVSVDICLAGHSEDKRYWRFAQHMFNEDGALCAYHEFAFGIMDLVARKIVTPPSRMLEAFANISKTEHFEIFEKSTLRMDRIPYGKTLDI